LMISTSIHFPNSNIISLFMAVYTLYCVYSHFLCLVFGWWGSWLIPYLF
jgi:hypothetical protein